MLPSIDATAQHCRRSPLPAEFLTGVERSIQQVRTGKNVQSVYHFLTVRMTTAVRFSEHTQAWKRNCSDRVRKEAGASSWEDSMGGSALRKPRSVRDGRGSVFPYVGILREHLIDPTSFRGSATNIRTTKIGWVEPSVCSVGRGT